MPVIKNDENINANDYLLNGGRVHESHMYNVYHSPPPYQLSFIEIKTFADYFLSVHLHHLVEWP